MFNTVLNNIEIYKFQKLQIILQISKASIYTFNLKAAE